MSDGNLDCAFILAQVQFSYQCIVKGLTEVEQNEQAKSILDKITALPEEIERLESLIREKKNSKYVLVCDLLLAACKTEEEKKHYAWILYWKHGKMADAIATAIGIPVKNVGAYVGSAAITVTCKICSKQFEHSYQTRTDFERGAYPETCTECVRAVSQRADEEYAKRRADFDREQQHLKSMPYSEYLQTPHWQALRRQMLRRAAYRCQTCNAKGELHVHHRTYENRGNEDYTDLIVLCASCHEAFHQNRDLQP